MKHLHGVLVLTVSMVFSACRDDGQDNIGGDDGGDQSPDTESDSAGDGQ